jgi:hypothetical protein
MAKAGRKPQSKLEGFAEDLGRLLGTARAKADTWLDQRADIARHLAEIRDTASGLLADLTGQGKRAAAAVRRGHKATAGPARRRRRRGKLSPEGRAAIIAAQKARWAKVKKAKK